MLIDPKVFDEFLIWFFWSFAVFGCIVLALTFALVSIIIAEFVRRYRHGQKEGTGEPE